MKIRKRIICKIGRRSKKESLVDKSEELFIIIRVIV